MIEARRQMVFPIREATELNNVRRKELWKLEDRIATEAGSRGKAGKHEKTKLKDQSNERTEEELARTRVQTDIFEQIF